MNPRNRLAMLYGHGHSDTDTTHGKMANS